MRIEKLTVICRDNTKVKFPVQAGYELSFSGRHGITEQMSRARVLFLSRKWEENGGGRQACFTRWTAGSALKLAKRNNYFVIIMFLLSPFLSLPLSLALALSLSLSLSLSRTFFFSLSHLCLPSHEPSTGLFLFSASSLPQPNMSAALRCTTNVSFKYW